MIDIHSLLIAGICLIAIAGICVTAVMFIIIKMFYQMYRLSEKKFLAERTANKNYEYERYDEFVAKVQDLFEAQQADLMKLLVKSGVVERRKRNEPTEHLTTVSDTIIVSTEDLEGLGDGHGNTN